MKKLAFIGGLFVTALACVALGLLRSSMGWLMGGLALLCVAIYAYRLGVREKVKGLPSAGDRQDITLRNLSVAAWLIATADVVLFLLGWFVVRSIISGHAIDLDGVFQLLIFPAGIVFWWGLKWSEAAGTRKPQLLQALSDGFSWGGAFAVLGVLIGGVAAFRTVDAESGMSLDMGTLMRDLLKPATIVVLGGMASAFVLYWVNVALFQKLGSRDLALKAKS